MSVHEDLSRLLAGELPPDDAEALRRRIDAEPEVRAAWESLQEVRDLLGALPQEITPPAALDRAVLGLPAVERARPRSVVPWLAAAAAVVLGWAVANRGPEPDLVLLEGAQWVSGAALVHAGHARIEVDGVARIEVEPPTGVSRVPARPTREDSMRKEAMIAGLAGAVVTVTVYEGQALVYANDSAPTIVSAGETRAVGRPNPTITRAAPPPAGETEQQTIARLERELAETRNKLEEAAFVGAVTRGQLIAHQGEPVKWPDDVPASITPEHFAQTLAERLAEHPLKIENVDCAEYPCIAAMRVDPEAAALEPRDGWFKAVEEDLKGIVHDAYGETASVGLFHMRFDDDESGDVSDYVVFGAWDGQGEHQDAVRQRTSYRFDQMATDLEGNAGGR